MKVFISGGCKNGKSTIAEDIAVRLAAGGPLYYMATMIPHDEEDKVRIKRHVEARKGKGFLTVECGENLCDGARSVLPSDTDDTANCGKTLRDGTGRVMTENNDAAANCGETFCDSTGCVMTENNEDTAKCGKTLCGGTGRVLTGDNDVKAGEGRRGGAFLVDAVTALLSNHYDKPEAVLADLKEFCAMTDNAVFVSDFIYSAEEGYTAETEAYRKGLAGCDRYLASVCDVVLEVCAGQVITYKGKGLL